MLKHRSQPKVTEPHPKWEWLVLAHTGNHGPWQPVVCPFRSSEDDRWIWPWTLKDIANEIARDRIEGVTAYDGMKILCIDLRKDKVLPEAPGFPRTVQRTDRVKEITISIPKASISVAVLS
jgi:hypothetical protein